MNTRTRIKNILKNVDNVSRSTLLKKAKELGLEVKKGINDTKLRKDIKNQGERLISNFMDNILKQQREERKYITNTQGVKLTKKDYKEIKNLEREFNSKKDKIFNKFTKENDLSKVEKEYLKGASVRHVNSSENIELNVSFRHSDLFNSITPNVNIKQYKNAMREEIDNFSLHDVVNDRSKKLNEWLKDWQQTLELTPKQAKEIQILYKDMNVIEKSQFNKDLEHKMAMVESVTRNPKSGYDTYHALKEIVFTQEERKFVKS